MHWQVLEFAEARRVSGVEEGKLDVWATYSNLGRVQPSHTEPSDGEERVEQELLVSCRHDIDISRRTHQTGDGNSLSALVAALYNVVQPREDRKGGTLRTRTPKHQDSSTQSLNDENRDQA
jgi:hypothetical protein